MEGLGISKSKGLSMVRRLFLAIVVLVVVCGRQVLKAEPITYKFSGTASMFSDLTQKFHDVPFSGLLTLDSNPVSDIGVFPASKDGADVSLVLNISGQTLDFSSGPQVSNTTIGVSMHDVPSSQDYLYGGPAHEINVDAQLNPALGVNSPAYFKFTMTAYEPGSINSIDDFSNLKFPSRPAVAFGGNWLGHDSMDGGFAPISIEAVSTPEPSSLIVFVVIGASLCWHQCRHRLNREATGHLQTK